MVGPSALHCICKRSKRVKKEEQHDVLPESGGCIGWFTREDSIGSSGTSCETCADASPAALPGDPKANGRETKGQRPKRAKPGRPLLCDLDPSSQDIPDSLRKLLQRRKNNREYARRMNERRQKAVAELKTEMSFLHSEVSNGTSHIEAEETELRDLHLKLAQLQAEAKAIDRENENLRNHLIDLETYMSASTSSSYGGNSSGEDTELQPLQSDYSNPVLDDGLRIGGPFGTNFFQMRHAFQPCFASAT